MAGHRAPAMGLDGHGMRILTPSVTAKDRLENEAERMGNQCPRCRYWNLPRRKICRRCGKRVRPTR
jgi:uncharacterized OB-fold protein